MKKRMHLKGKRKRINVFILIPILILILILFLIIKYRDIKPMVISFSENEANKLATLIINTAIKEENIQIKDNLYSVENNLINYNTQKINEILTSITSKIQKYFNAIEEGNIDDIGKDILEKYDYKNLKKGVILYIPVGYLTGSSFLANSGPKIPLKIKLIGDVRTDVKEVLSDYGLNNALLKISVYVEVVTKSIIPFISNTETTKVEYPIVLKIIEGDVPEYYIGNR